jgi:hypothetical protein
MKRFDTLDKEATALTFENARLVDAIYAGDTSLQPKLDANRAKLATLNAEMKARTYHAGPSKRWICYR